MADLLEEVKKRVDGEKKSRVLVTTLTKKSAEDLATFFLSKGIKVKYLHSDIETLERIEILRDLRMGVIDVLIGINLLREGLDLPEVSLVGILDADKEGFLRSERSLIQTIGRAARNVEGRVILYADKITESMRKAISETDRRRGIQRAYNLEHGITPKTVIRNIRNWDVMAKDGMSITGAVLDKVTSAVSQFDFSKLRSVGDVRRAIEKSHEEMLKRAKAHEFEEAAQIRDRVKKLKQLELELLSAGPE